MIEARYDDIRRDIRPGDVIAFGGRGLLSWLIKTATWCPVSHVGIVKRTTTRVEVMESTSLPGTDRIGVQRTYLSERIEGYPGEIWWLPISDMFRSSMDMAAFWAWLRIIDGRGYDVCQAYLSWSVFRAREDYSRLFCSELVAGAWKAAGGLPGTANPAEVTPADVVRMQVYSGLYFQLAGASRVEINRYNTRSIT